MVEKGAKAHLVNLADEYRPTMDGEVLHSWAKEVVTAIRESDKGGRNDSRGPPHHCWNHHSSKHSRLCTIRCV